jgi:hypothetical protein
MVIHFLKMYVLFIASVGAKNQRGNTKYQPTFIFFVKIFKEKRPDSFFTFLIETTTKNVG